MSDLREAFEAWYNEEYVRPILPADRTEGGYQHPDAQAAWDAWQAALSANGGEVEPVAWAVFADNGNIRIWGREKPEAFPEAVPLYLSPTVKDFLTVQSEPIGYADPDSLNDYRAGDRLHIPVYRPDASEEWQSGIPVYLHPAPPSVAVPEGVDLDLVSAVLEDYANLQTSGAIPCANRYPASDVNEQAELLDMLTATPSPDHIADAGKMEAMLSEIVDMWDGPRYALQMKPLIDKARAMLAARLRTAGDEGEGRPTHNGGESDHG